MKSSYLPKGKRRKKERIRPPLLGQAFAFVKDPHGDLSFGSLLFLFSTLPSQAEGCRLSGLLETKILLLGPHQKLFYYSGGSIVFV